MWECPDYFEIGTKKLLSTSVQGLEGGIWDDCNVYQSGYFEIEGDILGEYKLSEYHLWDYGFDYYAPQSFETEDGRRIHISWMECRTVKSIRIQRFRLDGSIVLHFQEKSLKKTEKSVSVR